MHEIAHWQIEVTVGFRLLVGQPNHGVVKVHILPLERTRFVVAKSGKQ